MALHLSEISFIYPNTSRGLHSISTHIPSAKWTALIGRSGSGKSTLLRLMAGLMTPQTGRIGNPSGRRPGLVMQFPEHHFFSTTVLDEIAFGLVRSGVPRREIRETVVTALNAVGLDAEKVIDESPFQLSGGEQRLVAIAATLALQPPLLLLDEPAAGLDPLQRADLLQRLDAWSRDIGIGIVLSSHDMNEVARWADHLLVLQDGHLVYDGDLAGDENPFVRAAEWGIGVPTGIELLQMLQEAGAPVPSFARTAEEAATAILRTVSPSTAPKEDEP